MTSVIVVGGGAVGLCVAEALAARGACVTVLERDRCGIAASAGNAGWLTPSLAIPIPGPGVVGQSLRWLVNPSGPLWIAPTVDPAMLEWISLFLISCARPAYERGLGALQGAAARVGESFDRLVQRGAQFELHFDGLLYPAFSKLELDHLLQIQAELRDAGLRSPLERVGGAEMVALEGALSGRTVGGLAAIGERHLRPESFTAGVHARLHSLEATVVEGAAVSELVAAGSRWIVRGAEHEWSADALVLASGVETRELLLGLGRRLQIATAKGYSRTYPRTPTGPSRPVYLEHPKVAVSVFDEGVRVSGTLELGARGLALSARRLQAITVGAREAMPSWELPPDPVDWAGMRSLSPDGLPYIGAVPGHDDLYVATGHGTLGITLAPLTGELLGDLILGGKGDPLLAAFDPGRSIARQARSGG